MIEVERKYRLIQPAAVSQLSTKIGAWRSVVRQSDTVYLQDADSFANADKKRGYAVLRVRDAGGVTTLTAKRRRTGESAIEAEIETDEATASAFMEALRWNVVTRVSKTRHEAVVSNVLVALDNVDGLGHFVELEVIVQSDDDVPTALASIDEIATELGLRDEWIETLKYDELLTAGR